MLEYLFDSDYKDARSKYNDAKNKRSKLISIKRDITNDSWAIDSINHSMDYIYEDFARAIRVPTIQSRVSNKLAALKEPYQTSDGILITACDYIDAECALLSSKMDNANTTIESIKKSYKGGDGGSW